MAFETYDLPDTPPCPEDVVAPLQDQYNMLLQVMTKLMEYVTTALEVQGAPLTKIANRVRRTTSNGIRKNGELLEPIVTNLRQSVQDNITRQGAQISSYHITNPELLELFPPPYATGPQPPPSAPPDNPLGFPSDTVTYPPAQPQPTSAPIQPFSQPEPGPGPGPGPGPEPVQVQVVTVPREQIAERETKISAEKTVVVEPAFPDMLKLPSSQVEPEAAKPMYLEPSGAKEGSMYVIHHETKEEVLAREKAEAPFRVPQTITFKCPQVPVMLKGGLPPPGSKEWCENVDFIVKWFSDLGNQVWDIVEYLLTPKGQRELLHAAFPRDTSGTTWGNISNAIADILEALIKKAEPLSQLLHDIVTCARYWTTTLFRKCNPVALMALYTLKNILEWIKKFRVGTDAGVWATLDIHVRFPNLEESIELMIKYVCPISSPSTEIAVEAYLRDYIDDRILACILRIDGRDPESFAPYVLTQSEKLSPDDMIQYVRRKDGNADDERRELRKLGFLDKRYVEAKQELYWELPTIGDHLLWLRKNVFDDAYVQDFQLLDGFDTDDQIHKLPDMQGYKSLPQERPGYFWKKFGHDLTALGMRKEYASLHYAAHWLNPSFSELFAMTQRLRPGRVDDSLVFTTKDLLRVMQEQDVGPYFRKRLERVSHPVVNLTLQMKLFGLRVVDANELIEWLRDLGYVQEDAEKIAKGLTFETARLRAGSGRGWTPGNLARAYMYGLIDDEFVDKKMQPLGYSPNEIADLKDQATKQLQSTQRRRFYFKLFSSSINTIRDSYKCGSITREQFIDSVANLGFKDDASEAMADQIDVEIRNDFCKRTLAFIQGSFRKGKLDTSQAIHQLMQLGINDERIKLYIDLWTMQKEADPHAITAAKIIGWVAAGLLDIDTAQTRLRNLGWTDPDIMLYMADAKGQMAKRDARIQAQTIRASNKSVADQARLIKENKAQLRRLQTDLRRITGVGRLQKWIIDGLIEDEDFLTRMGEMGYDAENAQHYLDEAKLRIKVKNGQATGPTPQVDTGGAGQS